jgi:arylsulfatase A-like enzyme
MVRVTLLLLGLALALLPPAAAAQSSVEPLPVAGVRPDVVVVMTDDQTLRDMAAMPNTKRMIGDAGATFTNAFVSYPLCCPARATYLTGQYAHNHGVRTNAPPNGGIEALPKDHTIGVWMQKAGYDTVHVGKYLNGYGLRRRPTVPPGWSEWFGLVDKSTYQMWGYTLFENGTALTYGDFDVEDPALYQTDVLRDRAVKAIENHALDPDPLFLSLMFVAPHGESREPGSTTTPYLRPAPRHEGVFSGQALPRALQTEHDVSDKPLYVRSRSKLSAPARETILEDFRARRESLLAVDEAVAAIVDALGRAGRLERTYLLFTSDNGFMQGQHRVPKGKYFAYDASSHVPLLIRGPGILPGTQSAQMTTNTDLAATILDAGGATADRPLDGVSLLPFARDPLLTTPRAVLHEGLVGGDLDRDGTLAGKITGGPGTYAAVRTDRFLWVQWHSGARELYDLSVDPLELESRHDDPAYAGVRAALTAEVRRLRHCRASGCLGLTPLPAVQATPRARAQRRASGGQ